MKLRNKIHSLKKEVSSKGHHLGSYRKIFQLELTKVKLGMGNENRLDRYRL